MKKIWLLLICLCSTILLSCFNPPDVTMYPEETTSEKTTSPSNTGDNNPESSTSNGDVYDDGIEWGPLHT